MLTDIRGEAASANRREDARCCSSCGSSGLSVFYRVAGVAADPDALLDSRAAALAVPRGDICLAMCRSCGFVRNLAFEPALPPHTCDLPQPSTDAAILAERLIRRYDLRGKTIADLSVGTTLLDELCRRGPNVGLRFDVGEESDRLSADFIACRGRLDHIAGVRDYVRLIRRSIGGRKDTVVLFEVSDVRGLLDDLDVWAVSYDRASCFSLGSLARLVRCSGFDLLDLRRDASRSSLLVEACPANGGIGPYWEVENDLVELSRLVERFWEKAHEKVEASRRLVADARGHGERLVAWSAGRRTVTFLNTLDPPGLDIVVDEDPLRVGMYLPGCGAQVVSPGTLADYRPDAIVVPDPDDRLFAARTLRALGLRARLITP